MVEYSKVLGDDSVLTVEPFDLAGLFDELMQASRGATEAKGLKLSAISIRRSAWSRRTG